MRRLVGTLGLLAAALTLGCAEQLIAPGDCPDFCPNGQIVLVDTVFTTIITRDSAYRGYLQPYQSAQAAATEIPGVQSRPFFKLAPVPMRVKAVPGSATDTSTVRIFADSSRLRVAIVRKDTAAPNLRVQLYALPLTVDSTTTFTDLDPSFSGPIVDSVNVSDLLTRPLIRDTTLDRALGDSIRTDSAGHVLLIAPADSTYYLYFSLDTLQAPLTEVDSGRLAFGVRVVADTAVSVGFGTNESSTNGPVIEWFYHFTLTDSVNAKTDSISRVPSFDSFVFDPPNAPLDSNLAIGGAPSARSLIRVTIPPALRDSIDVVRATLLLVPVTPVNGVASDSFHIVARQVTTDLGAKSPLGNDAAGSVVIHPGVSDTVRLEITDMVRSWVLLDTLSTTAFMLSPLPEATSFTEARFYSSLTPAFRPALHVTFVRRFPFGRP
jgi:hypothetical protein